MGNEPTGTDREFLLEEERMDLAVEQTREAAERTLMSWIRTTLSMISFGFGLFKFLQYSPKFDPEHEHGNAPALLTSQNLGTALVGLGTLFLLVAMFQFAAVQKRLRSLTKTKASFPLALVAALSISMVGLFAMLNLLFRLGGF